VWVGKPSTLAEQDDSHIRMLPRFSVLGFDGHLFIVNTPSRKGRREGEGA